MLIKNRKTGEERIVTPETWAKMQDDNRDYNYKVIDSELSPVKKPVPSKIVDYIEEYKKKNPKKTTKPKTKPE